MTSNPPPSLQNRQRLHRRQNSIPVAFEATKVQMPPTVQRQMLHRRGQSYDVSRTSVRRQQFPGSAVSTHTNIGPIPGQQILREAQQQRTARPGQQQLHPRMNSSTAQQCGFVSTPQQQSINLSYDMTTSDMMSTPQGIIPQQYQNMQFPMQSDPMNSFMLDENNPNYFQMFHSMQNFEQTMPVSDRRMSQPDLRIQTGLRPYTPTQQLQTAHFPLTPVHTPMQQQAVLHTRSAQDSPRWNERETVIISPRPVSMQKSRSLQGIAEHQELHSFNEILEAPELAAASKSFSSVEPTKSRQLPQSRSMPAIPNDDSKLFGEFTDSELNLSSQNHLDLSADKAPSSPNRPALSPRRMSISDLNLEPGISASIEETNITLDDIAQYIEGPDPKDNKWICKFEGCEKRFGRKENIKSHVQTHLGDRQFKCNHCDKCFVRGHDLKRHAKIHTGSKAYACLCGNAFARHDALTRHRQRGMCIGAFEGVVRKEVKRGRPKKHRPDMGERVDKASRTRHKKQLSSASNGIDVYTSSASSCSLSSWGSPPAETMDNLSIHEPSAGSPIMKYDDNMNLFSLTAQSVGVIPVEHFNPQAQSTMHSDMFSFTPPASPGYSTGNKPSPNYRELTPADFASFTGDVDITMATVHHLPGKNTIRLSPRRLDESNLSNQAGPSNMIDDQFDLPSHQHLVSVTQGTSLPSLSHSSSPPPQEPTSALAFDFPDDNPLRMSTMSAMSFGLSTLNKAFDSSNANASDDSQRNEFDSFLDYNDESQMSLGLGLSTGNNDSFFDSL